MSLKPLNDRVLVKRLESEERTASGLYIPDTAKESPPRVKWSPWAPASTPTTASSFPWL